MNGLRATGISVQIDGARLVEDVSLELAPGQVVAVIGPNGAGKSTLLRALSGELPGTGSVELGGRPLRALSGSERAQILAVLRQETEVGFSFRVDEVVGFGRIPSRDQGLQAVPAALRVFDVEHLAERRYPTLSGGEKRRVQLARIWAQVHGVSGAVLLLDEPLAALDLRHQEQVLRAMRARAREGAAVLWVAHDLSLASLAADRVVLMREGRVVEVGRPREVMTPARVFEVFSVRADWVDSPAGAHLVVAPDLGD